MKPKRAGAGHVIVVLLAVTQIVVGQPAAGDAAPGSGSPTFRSRANLVVVPVIVRGESGNAIGNLRREDFQLFDKGKRQQITQFSAETPRPPLQPVKTLSVKSITVPDVSTGRERPPFIRPSRYVAYVFDDINLSFADLAWSRNGAERNTRTLSSTDRAAIFTTSGRTALEFTDDRDKLDEALLQLRPSPLARETVQTCPAITYYMADMILNGPLPSRDPNSGDSGNPALDAAVLDVKACRHLGSGDKSDAPEMARAAARQTLAAGDYETEVAIATLKQIVRRMGAIPGERMVVLLSPGFVTSAEFLPSLNDVVDYATRLNVTINALDAHGLYTDALDIDKQERDARATQIGQQLGRSSALAQRQSLAVLTEGSGGRLIERTNDIDSGLRQIASPPEYVYMLGFSPRDLRPDGAFHPLKVTLTTKGKYAIQARRGYFATRMFTDPQEAEKEEIEQALFAPDDIRDPAVETRTEYFKSPDGHAELNVLTHLDVRLLRLLKTGGRNANDVTVVACVLDHNGAWVDGKRNAVKLRLRDATVERMQGSGMTVKNTFNVPSGQYAVRTVVRDANGGLMSAESTVVEIP